MIRLGLPRSGAVRALAFTPDGATLVYLQSGKARYWEVAAARPRKDWDAALGGGPSNVRHIAIGPDGSQLALGKARDEVSVLALGPEPRALDLLMIGGGEIAGLQFLGEPDHLVVAPSCEQIGTGLPRAERLGAAVWDVARGERVASMRLHDPSLSGTKSATAAPDRPLVALGVPNIHILLWEPELGRGTAPPTFDKYRRGASPGWRPPDEDRQPPSLNYGGGNSAKALTFSRDGRLLAGVVGTRIVPWDLEGRERRPTLTGHTGNVAALAFAPAGRLLASAGRDGTLRLWDPTAAANPERARFEPGLGSLYAVAFSPDGTLVAIGGGGGIALIDVDERLAG